MRNFERDAMSAGIWTGKVRPGDFSWSLSRDSLFRFCKRAYFLRYLTAQGGWDPYSNTMSATAYREKHQRPMGSFLGELFRGAVQDALMDAPDGTPEQRKRMVDMILPRRIAARLATAMNVLKSEEHWNDPKSLHLVEMEHADVLLANAEQVIAFASQALKQAYLGWSNTSLALELCGMPRMTWNTRQRFLSFLESETEIWLHPGLVYYDKGELHCVDFLCRTGATLGGTEYSGKKAALFERYARLRPGGPRGVWHEFEFSTDSAELRMVEPCPGMGEYVRDSIRSMRTPMREDGTMRLEDFGKKKETASCAACRFRISCQILDTGD